MKTQVLLMHGALGSVADLEDLASCLRPEFEVRSLNFPGHGGLEFLEAPLGLENLRTYVNNYIESEFDKSLPLIVCGHSMGGYMGLYAALCGNTQIQAVCTVGTKLFWNQEISTREVAGLDPNRMIEKVPHFVKSLIEVHGEENWKKLMLEIGHFLRELGDKNPLAPTNVRELKTACRIMLGDRDRMVSLNETMDFFNALPNASLCIMPNTPHQFTKAVTSRMCFEIREMGDLLNMQVADQNQ